MADKEKINSIKSEEEVYEFDLPFDAAPSISKLNVNKVDTKEVVVEDDVQTKSLKPDATHLLNDIHGSSTNSVYVSDGSSSGNGKWGHVGVQASDPASTTVTTTKSRVTTAYPYLGVEGVSGSSYPLQLKPVSSFSISGIVYSAYESTVNYRYFGGWGILSGTATVLTNGSKDITSEFKEGDTFAIYYYSDYRNVVSGLATVINVTVSNITISGLIYSGLFSRGSSYSFSYTLQAWPISNINNGEIGYNTYTVE